MKRLGLRVLPSLVDGDVFASGAELLALEAEVTLLDRSLEAVVDELFANDVTSSRTPRSSLDAAFVVGEGVREVPVDPCEEIRFRLANIAEAIRLARAIPNGEGEVVIW